MNSTGSQYTGILSGKAGELMKIIKTAASLSVCLIMVLAYNSAATGKTYGGMAEYIENGGGIIITGCSGDPETLVLPSEIDGKPVVEIRENAFFRCSALKSVTIPKSVRRIGHHAFFRCENLETAEVNASVTSIEGGVFYECGSLSTVTLPDSVGRINSYAFYGCANLTELALPASLSSVGDYAFFESGLCKDDFSEIEFISPSAFSPEAIETESDSGETSSKTLLPLRQALHFLFSTAVIIMCITALKYIHPENVIKRRAGISSTLLPKHFFAKIKRRIFVSRTKKQR